MGRHKTQQERDAKAKRETVVNIELRHGRAWLPTKLENGEWTWLTQVTRYFAFQAGRWNLKATIARESFERFKQIEG